MKLEAKHDAQLCDNCLELSGDERCEYIQNNLYQKDISL